MTFSFLKTGTHWLMSIIHLLKHSDLLERGEPVQESVRTGVYFFERPIKPGYEMAKNADGPRLIYSHLALKHWKKLMDNNASLKVIYIIRNPKDTIVSYYHHEKQMPKPLKFDGNWDEYFQKWQSDGLKYGDIFQHVSELYPYHKHRANSIILFYEDMKKNLKENIKKISDFLHMDVSENVLDVITEMTQIENLKDNKELTTDDFTKFVPMSVFLRKGNVGGWEEYFTDEQNYIFDEKDKEILQPLGIKFDYK